MDHLVLVKDTIEFWQQRTSRPLTQEDGRQVIENIRGFFVTLERWASEPESVGRARDTEAV